MIAVTLSKTAVWYVLSTVPAAHITNTLHGTLVNMPSHSFYLKAHLFLKEQIASFVKYVYTVCCWNIVKQCRPSCVEMHGKNLYYLLFLFFLLLLVTTILSCFLHFCLQEHIPCSLGSPAITKINFKKNIFATDWYLNDLHCTLMTVQTTLCVLAPSFAMSLKDHAYSTNSRPLCHPTSEWPVAWMIEQVCLIIVYSMPWMEALICRRSMRDNL